MPTPPIKTRLTELTEQDILHVGADTEHFQAVVPFTIEKNGHRVYIPKSVLQYYNPKAQIPSSCVRYVDPDFFDARIKDLADEDIKPPTTYDASGRTPSYGSFAWMKVPLDEGICYDLTPSEMAKFMMLITTADDSFMIAPDIYTDEVISYLSKIFGLGVESVRNLLRTLRKKNMVYQNSRDEWLFESDLFLRGRMTKTIQNEAAKEGYRYVRMYFSVITQMFRDEELQLTLKYIPRMLPYLHQDLNVFCMNPYQEDPFLVSPLTAGQLCAAGGYAGSYYGKLTKVLFEKPIRTVRGLEVVMTRLKEPLHGLRKGSILLNPRVFYTGNAAVADEIEPLFIRRPRGHYKKRRKKADDA